MDNFGLLDGPGEVSSTESKKLDAMQLCMKYIVFNLVHVPDSTIDIPIHILQLMSIHIEMLIVHVASSLFIPVHSSSIASAMASRLTVGALRL